MKTFKDIAINTYFKFGNRTYKKIDFDHGKDIYNFYLKKFEPYDEIEPEIEYKFKINY
jgi:hypothetical protein